MPTPDLDAAAQFIAANARVLERRRFDRLFRGGSADAVRDAVAAYRNDDGGFGHALEPDARTPASQPLAVETALRVLDEADGWDEALVTPALDWLEEVAPDQGGATFVLPNVDGWPHAPWWVPDEGLPPSLISTGLIAATLLARATEHRWLDRASAWLWERIESFDGGHPYEVRAALAFLEHAPDRDRAHRAYETKIAPLLTRDDYVALDPKAPGEVHGPLDYAPRPGSPARAAFDDATIAAHLDHLAAAQRDDGGWTFNWLAWSPAAEREWRGAITVEALKTLQTNALEGSDPFLRRRD